MSRQSEEILVQVGNVRHKKNDGTLYLMAERCGWMIKSKETFSIQIKYCDVKAQKISPEGKPKIQLQLVMHDDSPGVTFQFVHPDGPQAQLRDRDVVKEMLQNLLPKFKKKVNKELEEKNRLLSENPELLQLYKDLVINQIQTADEFWKQHAAAAKSKAKQLAQKQPVGVSGSFLAEIKPQADGANGLKYNLTPDIIESIFKTYPAVRRKHLENVLQTGKMTEQDFWTKFFQSHYFHRDRVHAHGIKDIFTECAKDDDRAIKEQLKVGVSDKVANLSGFSDKTLDENYGGFDGEVANVVVKASSQSVSQSIIKRFNQHSIMVMKANDNHKDKVEVVAHNNGTNGQSTSTGATVVEEGASHGDDQSRKRLYDQLSYADLDPDPPKKTPKLTLSKVERYLNGPTTVPSSASNDFLNSFEDLSRSRTALRRELNAWSHEASPGRVLPSSHAVSALVDLSPGGSLMQSARSSTVDAIVSQCPNEVKKELAALYSSIGVLLRHFWPCFPPSTPAQQEKAAKMHDTLKRFQQVRLRPIENEMARNYPRMSAELTAHLNLMIEAAFRKYAAWKQKRLPAVMR